MSTRPFYVTLSFQYAYNQGEDSDCNMWSIQLIQSKENDAK